MLDPIAQLSRSGLFIVQDGTLVAALHDHIHECQPDRLIGNLIDKKYQVLRLLGEGGMGAVYKARHVMLDKEVALKTFRRTNLSDDAIVRFQREAQAIAKVNHKNVIQIFDYGLSGDGIPYYTMEYLIGQSLADRIMSVGPLQVAEASELFIQLCHGLTVAHSKGIIHRDLKPANVFIEVSLGSKGLAETAKLVDFGIASLSGRASLDQCVTNGGIILGSPLYMSPEQSMGAAISESSDIYSLGCTLFQALVGAPPFCASSALETIVLHQTARAPTLKEASGGRDFPPSLERLLATMLAKSPADRQSTIGLVAAQLSEHISEQPAIEVRRSRALEQVGNSQEFSVDGLTPKQTNKLVARASSWLQTLTTILLLGGMAGLCCQGVKSHAIASTQHGAVAAHIVSLRPTGVKSSTISQAASRQTFVPYTRTEKAKNGKIYITFKFPGDLEIGKFTCGAFPKGVIQARGDVTWERGQEGVAFQPSEQFLENPAYFDVFQPDHLNCLDLGHWRGCQQSDQLMRHVGKLTGLEVLSLDDTDISDNDLNELVNLRNLRCLSLNSTNVDGAALARLPQLRKLISLTFSGCRGANDLLAAMKGTTCLEGLYIDSSQLTAADFKTIGTFSNLRVLQASNSGMKSTDVAALGALTKLRSLDAQRCEITKEAIKSLQEMKRNGLVKLILSDSNWSAADMEQVSQIIPRAKFTDGAGPGSGSLTDSDLAEWLR
jgi:serine/threonine protein kinase